MICTGLYSCRGGTDPIYSQGFSAPELSFNADGGSSIITSQRDEWWFDFCCNIDDIYGVITEFPRCKDVFPDAGYSKDNKPGTCSDSTLSVTYDIINGHFEAVKIESNWFQVIKETPKQINFIIKANLTGYTRHLQLYVNDRMGTKIIISQSAAE